MRLRIHRTDGKTGTYVQDISRRAQVLAQRLDPATIFASGPIVIGVLNPFTVLNPDEVCWVEAIGEGEMPEGYRPPGVERMRRLSGREEYEALLARQWPRWRTNPKSSPGDLLEALVELSLRSGQSVYLHLTGVVADHPLDQALFGVPALTASIDPDGMLYINPKCIVRVRIYHSRSEVVYPRGIWFAEADEI